MTKRKRESNCHQTTRQHPTSGSTDSFVLSNDLLNHILGFFICPKKGIVDSDSLLACASTCHRWKNASYSQSLWKQLLVPQNDSRSPSHKSSENYKDVIHKALSIKEQGKEFDKDSLSSDLNPIGFVRRRTHTETNDPCTTWYDAVERAHGIPCLLAVSKTTSRHDESYNSRWMIQELYKGMKETLDFLRPMTETDSNKSSTPSSYYPRGIAVINNRIVRWYHGNFQERHSRLRNHRNVTTSSIGNQLSGGVSNLLRLEKSSETLSLDRPRLQMDHWATLVDWIIEIVECFDLKDETAFQAMSFMDRFLFLSPTQSLLRRKQYQLVAGSALFLASQCSHSTGTLEAHDVSFCADNSFVAADVQAMADMLLQTLNFRLAFPTILDFVRSYTRHVLPNLDEKNTSDRSYWMIRQIAELALQTPIHLSYKPSRIAACVLVLGRYSVPESVVGMLWPESLQQATGYSLLDLKSCLQELAGRLEEIRVQVPNLGMVTRRYRSLSRGGVAAVAIPPVHNFDFVTNFDQPT